MVIISAIYFQMVHSKDIHVNMKRGKCGKKLIFVNYSFSSVRGF